MRSGAKAVSPWIATRSWRPVIAGFPSILEPFSVRDAVLPVTETQPGNSRVEFQRFIVPEMVIGSFG